MLFGKHEEFVFHDNERFEYITFPQLDGFNKKIGFRSDDGLVLYLLERIEKLEEKVKALEIRKNSHDHEKKSH